MHFITRTQKTKSKTECDHHHDWIANGHIRTNLAKSDEPRDVAEEEREREREREKRKKKRDFHL